MFNLSMMQEFMASYEYSHRMPFNCNDVREVISNCIDKAAVHDKSDVPEGFFRAMGDFREHLSKRDVFLTGISWLSDPSTMDRMALTFTSGETGEVFCLRLLITTQSMIQPTSFTLTTPNSHIDLLKNKTITQKFSSEVIEPSIKSSLVFNTFNPDMNMFGRKLKNLTRGCEIKSIDFIERYGVGAEADFLRQLTALSSQPDNQVIMANRTREVLSTWRAYNEGDPSLEVSRDTIKAIMLDDNSFTDKESSDILNHIIQQLNESGETLISFAPLTLADHIPSRAKLVMSQSVVDAYLQAATTEQINSLLEVLSQKSFYEDSFSEDVASAIKKAQLNALQFDTGPARRTKAKL